jgi:2-oxoglutarate/2-oxoacid ferredoxin oxidoreductase subunit beta
MLANMAEQVLYRRPKSLTDTPTFYCPGCGHGIVHRILAELIDELGIRETTVGVAPVGCSVVAYDYLDIDMSEAAHGRAPAVATGIKRARPDLLVFAYQGDGDLASIGMAEIIHAANRGENYTTIFVNNTVYGMTGGQMAPTTLIDQKTTTSPEGRDAATMGYPIRMCEMIETLGSPFYIVRTAMHNPASIRETKAAIRRALTYQMEGRGFTFVEVLSTCPVHWHMTPKAAMETIAGVLQKVFPVRVFRDRGEHGHA